MIKLAVFIDKHYYTNKEATWPTLLASVSTISQAADCKHFENV